MEFAVRDEQQVAPVSAMLLLSARDSIPLVTVGARRECSAGRWALGRIDLDLIQQVVVGHPCIDRRSGSKQGLALALDARN